MTSQITLGRTRNEAFTSASETFVSLGATEATTMRPRNNSFRRRSTKSRLLVHQAFLTNEPSTSHTLLQHEHQRDCARPRRRAFFRRGQRTTQRIAQLLIARLSVCRYLRVQPNGRNCHPRSRPCSPRPTRRAFWIQGRNILNLLWGARAMLRHSSMGRLSRLLDNL